MIALSCTCGWTGNAPSRRQADVLLGDHNRLHCTLDRTCAICTNIGPGAVRELDKGEPPVFVCHSCNGDHPRSGRYGFGDAGALSRVVTGQSIPKKGA